MTAWVRNFIGFAISLLIAYLALYAGYRFPNTQTWAEKDYVVYGSQAAQSFFRPAAYVDNALTGMRSSLGPPGPRPR